MATEEQVRQWAREEWARLDQEKTLKAQAACNHARSGTLMLKTGIVVCDDCKKELTMDDAAHSDPGPMGSVDRGAIGRAK